MCLAIPSKVVSIDENLQGIVDVMGVERSASFDLTPEVQPGQYVLLHAGFSIEVVDEQTARETIEIIKQMEDVVGDELEAAQQQGGDPFQLTGVPGVTDAGAAAGGWGGAGMSFAEALMGEEAKPNMGPDPTAGLTLPSEKRGE